MTYCVTKVDKRVTTDDSYQIEQHDSGEEVLCLEVNWDEQDPELRSGVFCAESAENAKKSATGSTTSNEYFWHSAPVLREHGREVLRVSGQHSRSKKERSYVWRIALEQPRVTYRAHEVVRRVHIDS